MAKRKITTNRTERAREAFADSSRDLMPDSTLNALMPWFSPPLALFIEYQRIEIRLDQGEAHIVCERKSYQDGKVCEETLEARAPVEQYIKAVDQLQQQVQQTLQLMMMPWMLLMGPFAPHHRKS